MLLFCFKMDYYKEVLFNLLRDEFNSDVFLFTVSFIQYHFSEYLFTLEEFFCGNRKVT